MKWLVYGTYGWIGQQVMNLLLHQNEIVIQGKARLDNNDELENELLFNQPDRVMSFTGRTHGGNFTTIDYLEQKGKLVENVKDNLYGPFVLAMLCQKYNIHYTYMGTGCIFDGYNDDMGYDEESRPDFFGSSYSTVKGFADRMMHMFDNVLNVRIRMPITSDFHQRNFITKIMKYEYVCSIPNSMTVLPELLPIMINMAKNKHSGTINLTNPGVITHNEILEMVREIIDPNFTWKNFTIEEQNNILLGGRSNNMLNTNKLKELYPNVKSIKESVRDMIILMKDQYDPLSFKK